MDNIWCADLPEIKLISKYNNRIRFLLCAINIFIKYAWFVPLKEVKGITFTNTFQKR